MSSVVLVFLNSVQALPACRCECMYSLLGSLVLFYSVGSGGSYCRDANILGGVYVIGLFPDSALYYNPVHSPVSRFYVCHVLSCLARL